WRQLQRTGPPQGLSRDLLIRALANQLQEGSHGRANGALRRRLQTLAGEFDRDGASFDPGLVLKTGTTLVRQWRGQVHTVLVREDGFEYEGQRYRSLTMIAERITGAHWSGRRFFGLTTRARALAGAKTGRCPGQSAAAHGGTQGFAVRSTPANPPKRGSSRSSIRCRRSARPARRLSPASATKAGCVCARVMMMAGSPARGWIGRRCNGCSPTS